MLRQVNKATNGNKTVSGMFGVLVVSGINAFFPDLLNQVQLDWIMGVFYFIGAVGILHKGQKHINQKKQNE